MGYIRDLEGELRQLIDGLSEEKTEEVVRFVKGKVYESYKNGQENRAKKDKKA